MISLNNIWGFLKQFIPPLLQRPDGVHTSTADIGAVEYTAGGLSSYAGSVFSPTVLAMYWIPFIAPNTRKTLTQLAFEVTTAAAGGSFGRIYLADNTDADAFMGHGARFSPCRLLADSGNLDISTTGLKTYATSVPLKPGRMYWIGVHCDATVTLRGQLAYNVLPVGGSAGAGNQLHYLSRTNVALGSFSGFVPIMTRATVSGAASIVMRYTLA